MEMLSALNMQLNAMPAELKQFRSPVSISTQNTKHIPPWMMHYNYFYFARAPCPRSTQSHHSIPPALLNYNAAVLGVLATATLPKLLAVFVAQLLLLCPFHCCVLHVRKHPIMPTEDSVIYVSLISVSHR